MKALILNSGIGKRMGGLTKDKPKCMADIGGGFTIISWQLHVLQSAGVTEAVITTGPFADMLKSYVGDLKPKMDIEFVQNPQYDSTNYIYSIYCARESLRDDIILLHGDLVFEPSVAEDFMAFRESSVAVDCALPLPEKDFKARIEGGRVMAVGVEFFGDDCVACQPFYRIQKEDMLVWLSEIERFCESGRRSVYAENALNNITGGIIMRPAELDGRLCSEIDNEHDLSAISSRFLSCLGAERTIE